MERSKQIKSLETSIDQMQRIKRWIIAGDKQGEIEEVNEYIELYKDMLLKVKGVKNAP